MRGREAIEGHDTIALSLTPRPKAKPRTHEGRQMQKFSLRAWISESDHELVRLDAEAIDTLSTGFGVLVRLHKGSQLSFLRRRVNNEVWLPAAVHFRGGVCLVSRVRRRAGYVMCFSQPRLHADVPLFQDLRRSMWPARPAVTACRE